MKLIKPYTEILTSINGKEILEQIERVARTCYKSEDLIKDGSAEKMVQRLVDNHHEAMIEFADIIVKFVCDRGVSHEIVRHRLASYAQESTRYCNYTAGKFEGHITFIIPSWMLLKEGIYTGLQDAINEGYLNKAESGSTWLSCMLQCEDYYKQLIERGWAAQQARSVLPNSLKTEINVKMNLREWRHFFKMRCDTPAHPQMRELTIPLLHQFQSQIPIIFDDLKF